MPRRRRFKPRIDCVAILGKLSFYSSLYHYIYILLKSLFEGSTNIYNPPQTPPFEKEGLVVSLRLTSPAVSNILSVTSSFCTISMALYAKIKRSKNGAICKKKRCSANLEAPLKRWLPTILCILGCIIDEC